LVPSRYYYTLLNMLSQRLFRVAAAATLISLDLGACGDDDGPSGAGALAEATSGTVLDHSASADQSCGRRDLCGSQRSVGA
jgi:hypothetical protein